MLVLLLREDVLMGFIVGRGLCMSEKGVEDVRQRVSVFGSEKWLARF